MKKLKLEMDTLEVQSFATGPARPGRGTAFAHAAETQLDTDFAGEESGGCEPGTEAARVAADWPAKPTPTGWGETCEFLGPCGTN
jgi:hypothetical protein